MRYHSSQLKRKKCLEPRQCTLHEVFDLVGSVVAKLELKAGHS